MPLLKDTFLGELLKVAHKDGKVSADELNMLEKAEMGIAEYEDALSNALKDGFITPEEQQKLDSIKTKLLSEVQNAIDQDRVISEDEQELLFKILKLMGQLADLEDELTK